MATREDTRQFRSALHELENAVDEPVVPGEVARWCEGVQPELRKVRRMWNPVLEMHAEAFRTILDTNLDLGGRVEQLKAGDAVSGRALDRIVEKLAIAYEMTQSGHSGAEPFGEVDALREDLLSWVVHARAHEKEVDHWLLEASMRDTGSAD